MKCLKWLFVGLALAVAPATGTLVVRMPLPELVARSDLIVHGRCLATRVERLGDLLTTRVELLVDDGWKGCRAGELLDFRLPGGELGDEGLVIPGLPRLAAGDELVLFLTPSDDGALRVPVGLAQGAFRLARAPGTAPAGVRRDLAGMDLLDPLSGEVTAGAPEPPRSYDALREAVLALVAAEPSAPAETGR